MKKWHSTKKWHPMKKDKSDGSLLRRINKKTARKISNGMTMAAHDHDGRLEEDDNGRTVTTDHDWLDGNGNLTK